MSKYTVRWSRYAKASTIIIPLFIIGVFAFLFSKEQMQNPIIIGSAIILFAIFGYYTAKAPLSIALTENELILNRLIGKLSISYTDIKSIIVYESDGTDRKISGSSGFCGYIGYFRNKQFGRYHANVGDFKQSFIIKKKNSKQYLLSCEDYETLVSEVKSYLP